MGKLLKYGFYFLLFFIMFASSMAGAMGGQNNYSMLCIGILFFFILKALFKPIIRPILRRIFA